MCGYGDVSALERNPDEGSQLHQVDSRDDSKLQKKRYQVVICLSNEDCSSRLLSLSPKLPVSGLRCSSLGLLCRFWLINNYVISYMLI